MPAENALADVVNWTLHGAPAGMAVEAQPGSDGQSSLVLRWTPGYIAAQGDDTIVRAVSGEKIGTLITA